MFKPFETVIDSPMTHSSVNGPAILKVADEMERQKDIGFSMKSTFSGAACGTAACVAGWAFLILKPEIKAKDFYTTYQNYRNLVGDRFVPFASRLLGISEDKAWDLFYAKNHLHADWHHMGEEYRPQAIKVLRHLAYTGEVRWDLFA